MLETPTPLATLPQPFSQDPPRRIIKEVILDLDSQHLRTVLPGITAMEIGAVEAAEGAEDTQEIVPGMTISEAETDATTSDEMTAMIEVLAATTAGMTDNSADDHTLVLVHLRPAAVSALARVRTLVRDLARQRLQIDVELAQRPAPLPAEMIVKSVASKSMLT